MGQYLEVSLVYVLIPANPALHRFSSGTETSSLAVASAAAAAAAARMKVNHHSISPAEVQFVFGSPLQGHFRTPHVVGLSINLQNANSVYFADK